MVELSDIQCISEMVVADIDVETILGLDFLRSHNSKIDVTEETLTIQAGLMQPLLSNKRWRTQSQQGQALTILSM